MSISPPTSTASPGRDARPSPVIPPQFVRFPQQFADTHLYTWVERGTVRVMSLAQEHNTMSLARAQTRTARSGDKRTNHQATAPPTSTAWLGERNLFQRLFFGGICSKCFYKDCGAERKNELIFWNRTQHSGYYM